MRKMRILAWVLVLAALLAACGTKRITPEEATALALEKIRADASDQYSVLFEERITCEYEERDKGCFYKVEVPFDCQCHAYYERTFTVLVHAQTGEIERLMMTK